MRISTPWWMTRLLGVWLGVLLVAGCGQPRAGGVSEEPEELDSSLLGTWAQARVSAGMYHSLVVRLDGTVWAAGANSDGQLGDGTTTWRHVPVRVQGLRGVAAVAAGIRHSLALRYDGTVWAWGYNAFGQLGNGTTSNSSEPVLVQGLKGVTAVSAGGHHALALDAKGFLWSWGFNSYGQLGHGHPGRAPTPVLSLLY
ncbi:hypothetical protein JQX13_04475 [Archangium violaceum]|uniref:RCC1 domain-containing protein n=1 Tax=Archangium violaceum TaxID=83451 RepID=UPI00193AE53C|nr:hypothetical protein [Archangium violaceum]QRK09406.1 hypothetical protein JQX13_04475 [Archangium violaceum]